MVELIIVANSPLIGSTIKNVNFKDRYRSVPLGVRQRRDVLNEDLGNIKLKAGDIILPETKNKYIEKLHAKETGTDAHFALLSEKKIKSFKKNNFILVSRIIAAIILTASLGILHIMTAAIAGSASFITPIGYQTNLMVYSPGGYKFYDYFIVGAPLQLILTIVVPTVISLIWGI